MSCTIATREVEGIVICDINGRMSFPDPHVQNLMIRSLESGFRRFVINLQGVTYLDSYGMHDLVMAHNAVAAASGKLVLLSPTPRVRKTIEITMKRLFTILEDETAALQAVRT
jgi:anti-anti-sigma factor